MPRQRHLDRVDYRGKVRPSKPTGKVRRSVALALARTRMLAAGKATPPAPPKPAAPAPTPGSAAGRSRPRRRQSPVRRPVRVRHRAETGSNSGNRPAATQGVSGRFNANMRRRERLPLRKTACGVAFSHHTIVCHCGEHAMTALTTAEDILAAMAKVYANCRSYRDVGTHNSQQTPRWSPSTT